MPWVYEIPSWNLTHDDMHYYTTGRCTHGYTHVAYHLHVPATKVKVKSVHISLGPSPSSWLHKITRWIYMMHIPLDGVYHTTFTSLWSRVLFKVKCQRSNLSVSIKVLAGELKLNFLVGPGFSLSGYVNIYLASWLLFCCILYYIGL